MDFEFPCSSAFTRVSSFSILLSILVLASCRDSILRTTEFPSWNSEQYFFSLASIEEKDERIIIRK
ncbi:hypothetical protein MtrunA17_Chr5g0431841 [Medicago truncatula]|uniref:Uncharacterized protein n=1 Tax=Medicago truncatula TaxID=3880 RepID=A0A396HTJ9_MEDTR|nr:hypothetical protein MtrunA17_Chr5g0431841 [Medicago truncatula]